MTPAGPGAASVSAGQWRQSAAGASAIRDLTERAVRADGVAPISGHVVEALALGAANWLPADADGVVPGDRAETAAVSAVAVAVDADPAEVVVDPDSRGHGLGTALVRAAVERQNAVWAYGDLPAAARVADRLGLVRGRVLLQLRRGTINPDSADRDSPDFPGAGPAVELPPGITVRTFVPGRDEEAFLAVNARAFAWHPEQGRLDIAGLRAEMQQPWFDPAGFFLAVRAGEVVGFHWTKVHPADPTPGAGEPDAAGDRRPVGEVFVIGVDPDAGIRGLGAPLTAIGLEYLSGRGIGTVMLFVEGDNGPALRLYQRFGFRTHLSNVVYSRPAAPRG